MAAKGDTAGVIAPPPLIFLAGLVAGYGMDYLWRTPPLPFDRETGYMIGAVYGAIGIGVAVAALLGFRRAGTSPEPWHPTSALVVQGIYRRTRNPMYLGITLIYLGITAAFGGLWMAGCYCRCWSSCITVSSRARNAIWKRSSVTAIETIRHRSGDGFDATLTGANYWKGVERHGKRGIRIGAG